MLASLPGSFTLESPEELTHGHMHCNFCDFQVAFVHGNKAAGCEAHVKNSNHASSAAESQKRGMVYRKCTSHVWEFFKPPTVMEVNGKNVKRVHCLLCTQQLADDGGMSNLMSHLQVKHLEEYKRCTNDCSKSCKTQNTLHSLSRVCPPERATAITKCIAEFVARDLHPISVADGQGFTRLLNYLELGYKVPSCNCFLYQNLVGGAVFILQLSVCFTFRISRCRKPTFVAALLRITVESIEYSR